MTEATPAPAPAGPLSEAEDKQWASFAHLGGILFILPSLIIFLVFKDRGAKTKVEAKEALNWQITFAILWIVAQIIVAIITAIAVGAAIATGAYGATGITGILWLLPGAVWVVNVIFSILGFVKVNSGGSYRYPFAFRFIK
jgi:uncharacterized Tic20 family protein